MDFDPEYVRPVLHFLRTGHLCLDTTVSRHAVQDVADALELRELSDLLRSTAVLGRGEFIQWVRSSKHSDIFPNQINVVGLCLSGLTLFNVRLERSLFHGTDFSSVRTIPWHLCPLAPVCATRQSWLWKLCLIWGKCM